MRCPRRHKFFNSRHRYYQNVDSTFQYQRLLKCGDINPNPGPTKFPCACSEPSYARTISEPYNGTAATCGAMLNVLMFPRTDNTWYCNACTFKWISDSFFSDSTRESLNNSTSTNSDTSEPGVVVDYKASIMAYYKFNLSIAHQNINSLRNKMDEIRT